MRPFILHLALGHDLCGWVRNTAAGVEVRLQGSPVLLDECLQALDIDLPPLAEITARHWVEVPDAPRYSRFEILPSRIGESGGDLRAPADITVCPECLQELFDPSDRRWRYPFINCTHCGPRYSLIAGLPYDRARTSMQAFELCADCESEYEHPGDRRFHAQPIACAACGPSLWAENAQGRLEGDPLALALQALQQGQVLAIKGIGGFHLVCDARNPEAVARLRAGKQRPRKPLAIMAANPASIEGWLQLGPVAREALTGAAAPVVLLPRRPDAEGADPLAANVAPDLPTVGIMLPHSPLHWLLFHQAAGQPRGIEWLSQPQDLLLVMTSANRSGAPLLIDNRQAREQLAGLVDLWLLHDREILTRSDDSVVSALDPQRVVPVRLGRGLAPMVLSKADDGPTILALGGHLKTSLCLMQGRRILLSQHLGDLQHPDACRALEPALDAFCCLHDAQPEFIACDLHPDFYSSRLAHRLARLWSVPLQPVQHHQAHACAVLAEHGVEPPALALVLDGFGLGTDGVARGGELLCIRHDGAEMLGSLSELPLPGGDLAAREPWRMAAAVLFRLGRSAEIASRFGDFPPAKHLPMLLERGFNCPPTTSAGRLFDAVAALLGICTRQSFEAEAAMLLEARAGGAVRPMAGGWQICADNHLDFMPLLGQLADCRYPAAGAALFHATLVAGLVDWVRAAAARSGLRQVVLSGGCMLNAPLREGLVQGLVACGLQPLLPVQVPPNDAGLALGQAWAVHMHLLHPAHNNNRRSL